MGGKALKNVKTRRYQLDEYLKISTNLIDNLRTLFPEYEISDIPYLRDKDSFGDLDILVSFDEKNTIKNITDGVKKYFYPDEYFLNGRSFSFNFKDLQVDIIFTPRECFQLSKVYYSNNDAGMLIGRISHSIGLKYGPEYLRFVLYEDSSKLCDIKLTNDPKRIFNILDLDYDKFLNGFNNYDELFDYLTFSKFFCYNIFNSSLVNSASRRRDNKRNSLHLFFEFLTLNRERFPLDTEVFLNADKTEYINKLFPDIKIYEIIKKKRLELKLKRESSEKWNGKIIQELFPHLIGKKLGIAIFNFKHYISEKYPKTDFDDYIINNYFNNILTDFKSTL